MSPKDLCTIDILDQVINSGATILKIEGRGKGPEYVHTVTKIYRNAIQAIQEGTYNKEKIADWKNELDKIYNRGFWEGYYLGRELGEWTTNPGSAAREKKVRIQMIQKNFPASLIFSYNPQYTTKHNGYKNENLAGNYENFIFSERFPRDLELISSIKRGSENKELSVSIDNKFPVFISQEIMK